MTICPQVWQRFMYSGHPVFQKAVELLHPASAKLEEADSFPSLPHPYQGSLSGADAFQTIVEWLYSRLQQPRSSAVFGT